MLSLADRLSYVPEVLDREANVGRPGSRGEGRHQVALREDLGGGASFIADTGLLLASLSVPLRLNPQLLDLGLC